MRAYPSSVFAKQDPGFWAALGSYLIWGMLPLYWHALYTVSPYLILCHRIVWSCAFIFPLVVASRRVGEVLRAARDAKAMRILFCSSVLLAANWLIFIWAVNNDRVLDTSLGYYINPLITIFLGVVIFRDRPSRAQWIAIGLAALGVGAEVVINGVLPWVSLTLAVSFALYALLRKLAPVESLPGLALETAMLTPLALGYILWTGSGGVPAWGGTASETALLAGAGVVTSVPLILYAYGARHIPFTTLGLLQYASPTCSFLIGVFVFGETFTLGRVVSFSAVWLALALYMADSVRRMRGYRAASSTDSSADR